MSLNERAGSPRPLRPGRASWVVPLPAVRPEADAAPDLVVVREVVELAGERTAPLADELPLAVLVEVEPALHEQTESARVLGHVPPGHAAADEAPARDVVDRHVREQRRVRVVLEVELHAELRVQLRVGAEHGLEAHAEAEVLGADRGGREVLVGVVDEPLLAEVGAEVDRQAALHVHLRGAGVRGGLARLVDHHRANGVDAALLDDHGVVDEVRGRDRRRCRRRRPSGPRPRPWPSSRRP